MIQMGDTRPVAQADGRGFSKLEMEESGGESGPPVASARMENASTKRKKITGGYLSEAGASIVDRKLGLDVVPTTGIIKLAAPTFNYSRIDRAKARTKERIYTRYPDLGRRFKTVGLPDKAGSFQLFVTGYQDAVHWIRTWEQFPEQTPPPVTQTHFQQQFERMVILDYIIRNTDRGNDNWLIKYDQADVNEQSELSVPMDPMQPNKPADGNLIDIEAGPDPSPPPPPVEAAAASSSSSSNQPPELEWADVTVPQITIAAIDNGLAFPFKHPDEWRAYPFGWAFLPIARQCFSQETIDRYLPLLDDANFVAELGEELRDVFKSDKGFDKKMFERQLSVMRGQIFNLREALRTKKSPYQLVLMPAQYMVEVKQKKRKRGEKKSRREQAEETTWSDQDIVIGASSGGEGQPGPSSSTAPPRAGRSWNETYKQKIETRMPFFRYW
ncbi:hypothetical protein PRIPAC_97565 [Pristionchus pacificus]|uniref:Phosphatidylinositol 4-kinase type 2 n=1 Tax=Pristionchus pacificus TaxID=54126 RepID=A0A2A6BIX0_PRIPA|nr:hypothetical protein PRIPAC_97565 [Pristionchus pacificus]|eukprot:PDM65793.1 hypothetical protein PRIPAC_45194 [Pristionchus pacificus]